VPDPVNHRQAWLSSRRGYALTRAVLRFIMDNAYSAYNGPDGFCYTEAFRCFVLELREQYADVDLDDFAAASRVPLELLEQWTGEGPA
jgi:hypothetical protein